MRSRYSIAESKLVYESWLGEQLLNCSLQEVKLINDMVLGLKTSLRRLGLGKSEK